MRILVLAMASAVIVALRADATVMKYVIHSEDILGVSARGSIVAVSLPVVDPSLTSQPELSFEFAFPLPSGLREAIRHTYFVYSPTYLVAHFELPDTQSASSLAHFLKAKQTTVKRSNQAMQRTAGRSTFQLSMTSAFNRQPHAPSPAVADLGSR